MLIGLLLSGNTYADTIYNGTFIDAHSQVGKLITDETVSKIINKNDVDVTLLSIRGKLKTATQRYRSIQRLTQNKIRYLIPTKLIPLVNEGKEKALTPSNMQKHTKPPYCLQFTQCSKHLAWFLYKFVLIKKSI